MFHLPIKAFQILIDECPIFLEFLELHREPLFLYFERTDSTFMGDEGRLWSGTNLHYLLLDPTDGRRDEKMILREQVPDITQWHDDLSTDPAVVSIEIKNVFIFRVEEELFETF